MLSITRKGGAIELILISDATRSTATTQFQKNLYRPWSHNRLFTHEVPANADSQDRNSAGRAPAMLCPRSDF
ncbi:hypothetical protein L6164_009990 [Bauhinia variegata]|uniref:Uncharacterized protein n=1 Tax=Bauhinia variegata TaxID=167791 RepID=A0ACB9PLS5_BAUVA|nr:hypothetical protein L6164_009990 [Bauhinia variegata]